MENNRIRQLAGLLTEKKHSSKTKWTPPAGFFSGSASEIVKGLLEAPGGSSKAMARLNFYVNRAGSNLSDDDKARLEKAKGALSKKLAAMKEEVEKVARAAGVVLERKDEDDDAAMNMDGEGEGAGKDDEEEELPKIVLQIAKKAVGKDEEELADLLMKVYDSGFKDGVKSTEEGEVKDSKKEVSEALLEAVSHLINKMMDQHSVYSLEGERGIKFLNKLIKVIGYSNMNEFFSDNSGAIEALIEWISSVRSPEWEKSLKDEVGDDEDDD